MKKCFSTIAKLWGNGLARTTIVFFTIVLMIIGGFTLSSYLKDSQRAQFVEALMQGREPTELIPNQIQDLSASNEIEPICLTLNPQSHHLVELGNQVSIQRSKGVLSVFFPEHSGVWIFHASVVGNLFRSDHLPVNRDDKLRPCHSPGASGKSRWQVLSKIRESWYRVSYETSS